MAVKRDLDAMILEMLMEACRADRAVDEARAPEPWTPPKLDICCAFRTRRHDHLSTRDFTMPSHLDTYRALRAYVTDRSTYPEKRRTAQETEDWYSTNDPDFTSSERYSEQLGDRISSMRGDAYELARLEEQILELKRKTAADYARFYLAVGVRARRMLDVDAADPNPVGEDLARCVEELSSQLGLPALLCGDSS
jgi:hypothetical protein